MFPFGSRDSSVTTVTRLRAEGSRNRGSITDSGNTFVSSAKLPGRPWFPSGPYSVGLGGIPPSSKAFGWEGEGGCSFIPAAPSSLRRFHRVSRGDKLD